jgi:SAM-dependent methyltransferase
MMKSISKFCDAADWFDPEVGEIIDLDLREPSRLHRKQWEFAMIFLVLRRLGMVRPDRVGLSLGGGTERLLYSLAHLIKHMTVTDLYDPDTVWDCARTNDPNEFVHVMRPFDVDDSKYHAVRMDMRSLDCDDRSFDFCYSSCSIEHIGSDADFLRHFDEVSRVLKDGGIYVFTTEISFINSTIQDPGNYVFAPDYLTDLVSRSSLEPVTDCDCYMTRNRANLPMPWEILQTALENGNDVTRRLIESIPHVTLLRGGHPFGSGLFVMKKNASRSGRRLHFNGLEELRVFMERGVQEFEALMGREIEADPTEINSVGSGLSAYRRLLRSIRQFSDLRKVSQANADIRSAVRSVSDGLGRGNE